MVNRLFNINLYRACVLIAALFLGAASVGAADIQRVEAKTLTKAKFNFPDDLSAKRLNVLFLGIADEQEIGQQQGDQLLLWHGELAAQGLFDLNVVPYHFPVMAGVPFFIKGIIRRAMRDVYQDKVPLEQVAVLHIDSTDDFTASLGVENDQLPTIALIDADGVIVRLFHDNPESLDIDSIAAAIITLSDNQASRIR